MLAGHSAGGLYVLNFAQLYPDQVAGVTLLDSMSPQQYTAIDGWPAFYEMYRRASAVLTPLSRLGVGHLIYDSASGDLPAPARDQERALAGGFLVGKEILVEIDVEAIHQKKS